MKYVPQNCCGGRVAGIVRLQIRLFSEFISQVADTLVITRVCFRPSSKRIAYVERKAVSIYPGDCCSSSLGSQGRCAAQRSPKESEEATTWAVVIREQEEGFATLRRFPTRNFSLHYLPSDVFTFPLLW